MSGSVSQSDRSFLHQFVWLIAGLSVVALGLLILAVHIYHRIPTDADPAAAQQLAARIAPISQVYAGDAGKAALAARQAAATAAAGSEAAYGGSTNGKTIYDNLCHTCHTPGIAGAPKLGDKAAWAPRLAEGMDTLLKHAIEGYHGPDGFFMPPKGGNPALTDAQVKAAVGWMTDQAR